MALFLDEGRPASFVCEKQVYHVGMKPTRCWFASAQEAVCNNQQKGGKEVGLSFAREGVNNDQDEACQ